MEDAHPICRSCLKECVEYKSLYKQGIICGALSTLGTLLSYVTDLSFEPDDGLPGNICVRCIKMLAKAYIFKKTVHEGNGALRNQLMELSADANPSKNENEEDFSLEYRTELHELAAAAQLKQAMDVEEFLTVAILRESNCREEEDIEIADSDDQTEEVVVEEEEEYHEQNEVYDEDHLKQDDEEPAEHIFEVLLQDVQNEQTVSTTLSEEGDDGDYKHIEKIENQTLIDYVEEAHHNIKPMVVKRRKKEADQKPFSPELKCQECGKQLSNQNSFKYHMQLHSDATPFLCSLCGQGFKTRNAYEGHVIIHNPNNPNTCRICNKSYRQPSSLRTHMLSHTGEKPFQCDICGKGMTQKSGYKKHMLVHTGEKPHTCDVCGREFRYSSNLIAHKRCHTGEKPYACPSCEKCFPTSEQMKRHMLVHSGDRKFSCEICNKKFKRRSSMLSHKNLHSIDTKYTIKCEESTEKLSKSNVVELY